MVIDDYRRLGIGNELIRIKAQRGCFVPSPSLLLPLIGEQHMGAPLMGNQFYYVGYCQGYIQYTEIPARPVYGISDQFTGCAMAYFLFNNSKYIAHISLDSTPAYDKRAVWNQFVIQNKQHITQYAIFRPYDLHSEIADFMQCCYNQIDMTCRAIGLLPPNLECYSAVNDSTHRLVYCHHETRRRHFTNDLSREINIGPFLIPANARGW